MTVKKRWLQPVPNWHQPYSILPCPSLGLVNTTMSIDPASQLDYTVALATQPILQNTQSEYWLSSSLMWASTSLDWHPCQSAQQLLHHHQVNCFAGPLPLHMGHQQQPSVGPLFSSQGFKCLIAACYIGFGQYYGQRTKSSPPPAATTADWNQLSCSDTGTITTRHASRQEAKYVAYTSPGWEHNRLHLGTTNDTVGIAIVWLCSHSSTDGGGWHKAHPTAGVPFGAQHSNTNAVGSLFTAKMI